MKIMMIAGIAIAIIGLLLIMSTLHFNWGIGFQWMVERGHTGRFIAGWITFIVGVALVILAAYLNGQLK